MSQASMGDQIAQFRSTGDSEVDATKKAMGKTKTMKPTKKGEKPITFKEGGLHASTGTPEGEPIPASKHSAAASGKLGPKAKQQEDFYENVLK